MAKPVSSKKQRLRSWTTRDLLVTIVIGMAFGVILIPVTYAYVAFLGVGGLLTRSLIGSIYYLPAVFAAYALRKPGASILSSTVSALVAMPFSPYGGIVLGVGVLIGIVSELLIWVSTRYKNFRLVNLLFAGVVTGLLVFVLILFSLSHSDGFEWNSAVLVALILAALTFGFCAGLAKYLADSVAKTGVLANTALGETTADEI